MPERVHTVEFSGELACWTRPESSVERYSYPCPTPSAVRGLFDAIYWHPQFRWEATKIELLSVPQWIALRRNEVKERANTRAIDRWMAGKEQPEPIWADADKSLTGSDERGRTQRQTMALVRPRVRVSARIRPWPKFAGQRAKFDEVFDRRMRRGQCFHQPALGQREMVAFFGPPSERPPLPISQDLGLMTYDIFDLSRPGTSTDRPAISLFRAKIVDGVLAVPPYESDEVLKQEPPREETSETSETSKPDAATTGGR